MYRPQSLKEFGSTKHCMKVGKRKLYFICDKRIDYINLLRLQDKLIKRKIKFDMEMEPEKMKYRNFEVRAWYQDYDTKEIITMSINQYELHQYPREQETNIKFAVYAHDEENNLTWLADCLERETAEYLIIKLNQTR